MGECCGRQEGKAEESTILTGARLYLVDNGSGRGSVCLGSVSRRRRFGKVEGDGAEDALSVQRRRWNGRF